MLRRWRWAALLPLLAALWLLQAGSPLLAASIPTEVEKWVGKQVAELLKAEMGFTSDHNLTRRVQRIGDEVAAASPRQDVRYEFSILDLPDENAFALPGGYIFVSLGLLTKATSDEEVATVLAHEVAHVSENHFTKYLAASLMAALGLQYVDQHTKATWSALTQAGAYLSLLRFSRLNEAQADRRGVQFAYQAGYDPEGLVEFFYAIGGDGRGSYLSRLLSTHPATYDRIMAVRSNPLLSNDNYDALLQRARDRRHHFSLLKAAGLYQKASHLRPDELAPRLELASLSAHRGLLLEAAAAYEDLGQSYPQGKEEAALLRSQAARPAPIPPSEEQLSPVQSKVQALAEALSAAQQESSPLLRKNSDALKAAAANFQLNDLMDQVLLLEPNFWDEKRLVLLAQAKMIVQSAQSASVRIAHANRDAGRTEEEWSAFSNELQAALKTPHSPEALQLLLDKVGDMCADGALAARISKNAAENCSAAVRRLDSCLGTLTPLLLALVDAGMQKHAMSVAAAASLEALALKAGAAASQADRLGARASQDCSSAILRLRQWELEVKYAQACPRARQTLVEMLAYHLGVKPEEVSERVSDGLGYGQAALVLAIANARSAQQEGGCAFTLGANVSAEEVVRAGDGVSPVDVAVKWGMRLDALLIPLDMLHKDAEAITP